MQKLTLTLLALLTLACVREPEWVQINNNPETMEEMVVDPGFDFTTTQNRDFTVSAKDPKGIPMPHVPVYLLTDVPENGGVKLAMGQTDENGEWHFSGVLPASQDTVVVYTPYPGLPNAYKVTLLGNFTTMTLGGDPSTAEKHVKVYDGGITNVLESYGKTDNYSSRYRFLSTYNSSGVPNNRTPVRDYISQDLLDLVANSLPEAQQVPVNNPGYIAENVNADTRLQDSAEVFVTFVHEGAGYRNALGFYKYDLNNPPASSDDIDSLYIVFPNVSFNGSGGGLTSGDKVKLGNFPANTGIGWFLVPDGWTGSTVADVEETKFSNKNFNTYTTAPNRAHVALLKDVNRELLLLGMEDITRPGGDKDFNDAVFYVTANPFEAIIVENLAQARVATGNDDDEDGVINTNDAYPNDPTRAFNIYQPGTGAFGSIGFEDQWPYRGDYDMNDLVVDYNYQIVTNTANKAVELKCKFIVQAIGASFENGFGIMLNVPADAVQSVTGAQISGSTIQVASNGVESGQSKAVIMVFDNAQEVMGQQAGRYINTVTGGISATPDTIDMVITFTEPQAQADLGYSPYNPFIFTGRGRGYEVHLPDQLPTDLANQSLFGTGNDNSLATPNKYYKDKGNLPFAIHTPVQFAYPIEGQPIILGHLKFAAWAQSNGTTFTDWYTSKSGYRSTTKLYRQ